MSGYAKGTRKPKKGFPIKSISIGGVKIKPVVAIALLMAALYAVFLIGTGLGRGLEALMLPLLSFAMFAAFAYLSRSGGLAGLRPFTMLIDAFLALSTLSLAQALASFLNIFGPADMAIQRFSLVTTLSAGVAAVLLMAVLYLEKEPREAIYLKASPIRTALAGFAIMVVCGLIATGLAYLVFGSAAFMLAALNVLAFGLIGGVYEEALFRGLLLSRLRQVLNENYALPIQAIVFAVFEALAVYALAPNILLLPVILVASAILGYFLGMITLKNESILAPQLIHAGLYMLLAISLLMA